MLGKPVIGGTRIPVELVLSKLSEGATTDDLLDACPKLTKHDVHACLVWAADTLTREETVTTEPS